MMIADYMTELGRTARAVSVQLTASSDKVRSRVLLDIAERLDSARKALAKANQQDLKQAEASGLAGPLLDRLGMDTRAIDQMIESLKQVSALPDPIGQISNFNVRPSGLRVGKMRTPLGVVGIIYESRPNVTVDVAALCLKSGNAAILRGGSEAITSNMALAQCIDEALEMNGLSKAVQLVCTTDKDAVGSLIRMSQYVDVLIPRGGRALVERIDKEATVPVIKHLDGICHVYIDGSANPDMAMRVALNSKTEKEAVCCAMETLLVAESIAPLLLPKLVRRFQESGIEVRGCEKTMQLSDACTQAQEEDWHAEYLGPVLAVRVVKDIDEAMAHIAEYGSHHTDAIICERQDLAWRFLREVDSASVLVNASTQFADGFEFGLGAEVGISTDKLHARGPVGLEGLTSEKFIVLGQGEVRDRKS